MSNFACTCGHIISDGQYPNEVTGHLLSSKSGEVFFQAISDTIDDYLRHAANSDVEGWRKKHFNEMYPPDISAGGMIHDVLTSRFFDLTLATIECDECGRIWVQRSPDVNHYHAYSADDDAESRIKLLGYNDSAGESAKQRSGTNQ